VDVTSDFLIRCLDTCCDPAARTACRSEVIGSFTLFVNEGGGWRGLGAAVASFLVDHVQTLGIATLFLSTGDEGVARIHDRVGFEGVGTACEPVGS
jgi:hypothetical protein